MKREKLFLATVLALVLAAAGCSTAPVGEGGEESGGVASRIMRPKPQPVTIPAGTELDVRLSTGLNSDNNRAGDSFEGSLDVPITAGDKVVLPKGAPVKGKVTNAVESGRLKQRAELWVTLTEVFANGKWIPVSTSTTGHKEGSKATRNILFIGGGAGGGAAIGGATGGGKGAGIGAAIGAGAGTAAAMLTGKRDVKFPPETLLRFQLEQEAKIQ
ncbi:MAG: hypothetical protein ACRD4D_01405 [Candidatus Acidiferrales bacterium]